MSGTVSFLLLPCHFLLCSLSLSLSLSRFLSFIKSINCSVTVPFPSLIQLCDCPVPVSFPVFVPVLDNKCLVFRPESALKFMHSAYSAYIKGLNPDMSNYFLAREYKQTLRRFFSVFNEFSHRNCV